MRKNSIFLFIISLFYVIPASADVDINEENFPDVNFRNYLLSLSCGNDGIITETEIAEIKYIGINSVKNLKGIEFFTALEQLDCSGSQLATVDLSKNTELKELNCANNQLTSLDLSKNTALVKLNCSYNKLTILDVSENKVLKELNCGANLLVSIDLTKNSALETLICHNCQLTSLDITKNYALIDLSCGGNQFNTIDITMNTGLISLDCSYCKLNTLDISKNTAMEWLFCSNNELVTLDISNNSKLIQLDCSNNKLTKLDASENKYLEGIQFNQNQIKGNNMDALVESLPTVSNGRLYAISNENEGNVMTIIQVNAAKEKGWTSYWWDGIWGYYSGSIPSSIRVLKDERPLDVKYFDLHGNNINTLHKGINIIHKKDGTINKVFIK